MITNLPLVRNYPLRAIAALLLFGFLFHPDPAGGIESGSSAEAQDPSLDVQLGLSRIFDSGLETAGPGRATAINEPLTHSCSAQPDAVNLAAGRESRP